MDNATDYALDPSYSARLTGRVAPQPARNGELATPVVIAGVRFSVIREGGWIALQCEEWPSLSGYGSTLDEARNMLYEAIEDARKAYVECDENELTQKAMMLRAFLLERFPS